MCEKGSEALEVGEGGGEGDEARVAQADAGESGGWAGSRLPKRLERVPDMERAWRMMLGGWLELETARLSEGRGGAWGGEGGVGGDSVGAVGGWACLTGLGLMARMARLVLLGEDGSEAVPVERGAERVGEAACGASCGPLMAPGWSWIRSSRR